jgi:Adenylate and Guanylate cyclase catalytic domain/3'5'-cyclic nucleotide phosphodiesterase
MKSLSIVTKELESSLGPCDLRGRCGLHSGPVTAGILRGEKARFQLFGDSMNTASRMESNGIPGKIHISMTTATLLEKAGKAHWITPREEVVFMKGKGNQQTYFAHPKSNGTTVQSGTTHESGETNFDAPYFTHLQDHSFMTDTGDESIQEMVDETAEILHRHLSHVVASRSTDPSIVLGDDCDPSAHQTTVSAAAKDQLRHFVLHVAHLHRRVPFHAFHHASQVTRIAGDFMMSAMNVECEASQQRDEGIEQTPNFDPLMRFAAVFAALIHHVDHRGLTDEELTLENAAVVAVYGDQSVAVQNAIDIAWKAFVDGPYGDLRACVWATDEERDRFHQLLTSAALATSIFDKQRQRQRNRAAIEIEQVDMKNGTLFECVMQAAGAFHYVQEWATYRKFSALLFEERYQAWARGVSGAEDPSSYWYKREIEVFKNAIAPLVYRVEECGAFEEIGRRIGRYANKNQAQWASTGHEIVGEMLLHCKAQYEHRSDIND